MSMSDNEGCNDPTHDHSGEDFQGVTIGALFGGPSPRQREREKMQAQSMAERVYIFIEGLDVDQLMVLRFMLAMDGKSATNNYFEGMVVSTLRLMHRADAETGITLDSFHTDPPVTTDRKPNSA